MRPCVTPARAKPRQLRHCLLFLALVLLVLIQTACVQLAEVDSTHASVYAPMLGREFELKEQLLVRGVKRDQKSTGPDYILIMPAPGIGGRFIINLGTVPAGSRFRIIGVVTHSFKLVPFTQYVISFADHRIVDGRGKEVRIPDASGFQLYVRPASPDAAPQLNGHYFRLLEGSSK